MPIPPSLRGRRPWQSRVFAEVDGVADGQSALDCFAALAMTRGAMDAVSARVRLSRGHRPLAVQCGVAGVKLCVGCELLSGLSCTVSLCAAILKGLRHKQVSSFGVYFLGLAACLVVDAHQKWPCS